MFKKIVKIDLFNDINFGTFQLIATQIQLSEILLGISKGTILAKQQHAIS
jgi:hypothetical protein